MTTPTTHPSGAAPEGRSGRGPGAGPEPDPATDLDGPDGSPVAPFVAGLAMVGLGLLVLHEVFAIRADDFGPDGPRFLPLVVVGLWLGLSVAYLGQQAARVLRRRPGLPAERFAHSLGVAALLGLLVAYAYVLDPLGYLIATFLFFVGSSRALGSRQLRRDVVVAAGLTVVVYFLFTRALGVHLPEGVLPL